MLWLYLFILWLIAVLSILLVYRRDLLALWHEPVFRHPVLIIESDDWGAGPVAQAKALRRLAETLSRYKDRQGRPPVMTIAVVLAIPDGEAIRASGSYHRRELGHGCFLPVREALQGGVSAGVFSLQLHGLEHYWPATLMNSGEKPVRQWLEQDQPQSTEDLPAHLQSRWLDAGQLPSRPLSAEQTEQAVQEETALFAAVLGQDAKVVVPPTFIWNDKTETAWARHGVEFLVTPGRRNGCRDERGEPGCAGKVIRNGEKSNDLTCIVRNDYFEPERGHTAQRALEALKLRSGQGRPCLLETHRSNFLGDESERAGEELDRLMRDALGTFGDLRFMSTLELGQAMRDGSGPLLELRPLLRLAPWTARLEELPRFSKLGRLTGLRLLIHLAVKLLQTGDSSLHSEDKEFTKWR